MYCKYCGGKIASDTTKCVSCGANIDLDDGGQSFFDDNELNIWKSGGVSYDVQSSVPKTEMREPLPERAEFDEEYKKAFAKSQVNVGKRGGYSRKSSKKKKTVFDYLNISSSNRLIIFCIASALAIVLLAVAIIAVLSSGGESDEAASQTEASGYTQQAENTDAEQSNQENAQDVLNDKTEIKDVKIFDKDGNEVSHSVSAYMDKNNTLYVSLDKILKYEGYKNGRASDDDTNRILYEHKSNGKIIEIEKGTNKIWITEPGEDSVMQLLDSVNFNVGDNTYVPVKSFLVKYGYDGDKIKWDAKEKTLYFSK